MSRKIPIGYVVKRPLTLWGKKRTIGEYLPREEVASMARIESMVRAGRFKEVWTEEDIPVVKKTKTAPRKNKKKSLENFTPAPVSK